MKSPSMRDMAAGRPAVQTNRKTFAQTILNKMKPGKLQPAAMVGFEPGEGGMVRQSITIELEPIAGRVITPIFAHVQAVFVPTEAMVTLNEPGSEYAGLREIIRDRLANKQVLFPTTDGEYPVSQNMRINPVQINGYRAVNATPKLAHACAVNFLRREIYHKANLLGAADGVFVTPALVGQTVLDMFNGALDPDDRVNGAVSLQIPMITLPVDGIGTQGTGANETNVFVNETDANGVTYPIGQPLNSTNPNRSFIKMKADGVSPDVTATLNGLAAGSVSLVDFYQAKELDRVTRAVDELIDAYPQYGEEMALRWFHGLQVDTAGLPFLAVNRVIDLNKSVAPATDAVGVQADIMRTDFGATLSFGVPVPRTELGGVMITFITIKPDETLGDQPHPFATRPFAARNHVVDSMDIDPKPVLLRNLSNKDLPVASEAQVAFYTGLGALEQNYVDYGLALNLPKNSVTNRTLIWKYELPLSVTPDNILYPASFPAYPFADQTGDVVTYSISTAATIVTPQQFGPSPVEDLSVVDDLEIDVQN